MTARVWFVLGAVLAGAASLAVPAPGGEATGLIDQIGTHRRNLMSAGVRAPVTQAGPASGELRRTIEAIQNMRIGPVKEEERPAEPGETRTPGALPPAIPGPDMSAADQAKPGESLLSDAALEQIKQLPAERVANPLGLADALYLSNHLPEAFAVYEKITAAKDATADTKAWALFQMANCKRPAEPGQAVALYKRLATEHPKSTWTTVATVRQQLLEWYGTVQPHAPTTPATPATTGPGTPAATAPATQATPTPGTRVTTTAGTQATTAPGMQAGTTTGAQATTPAATPSPTNPATPAATNPGTRVTTTPGAQATTDPATRAATPEEK